MPAPLSTMLCRLSWATAACALLFAPIAAAEEVEAAEVSGVQPAERPSVRVLLLGGYRAGVVMQSAFPVDPSGTLFDQRVYLDHRLRLHPRLEVGDRVVVGGEVDLLTGLLGGNLPDAEVMLDERLRWQATGARHAEARQLYFALEGRPVTMVAGLVTDHFGLGAVANDGGPAAAGFSRSPFGTDQFGDRVLRIGFGLPPSGMGGLAGHLAFDLFIDLVALDEQVDLFDRQELSLGPGARLTYREPLAQGGLWVAWHTTRAADGFTAEVFQADLFLDRTLPVGRGGDGWLRLAFEAVGRFGRTDLENGWPDVSRRKVASGAAVGQLELDLPGLAPVLALYGGVASGDADPTDGWETGLSLDRDLNAGAILFEEVLAGISARRAVALSELGGVDGRTLADEGALGGAVYAQPFVAFQPHPTVTIRVGGLVAGATVDPLLLVATDTPGVGGMTASAAQRSLGGELDAALDVQLPLVPAAQERTRVGLRLEYGHLFPGPALTEGWDEPVGPVDRLALQMGITF